MFSQVKYDSNGRFGIGTTSPENLLHLKASDPIMLFESLTEHDNTIRLCEGTTWLGAFLSYDGGVNKLIFGTHISSSTSTSDDKNVLSISRSTGQIELNPISTSYDFQSFVTKAPNYETQCYNVKLGTSNNFWVDGDGDVWHSGLHTISDASLKENVIDLTSSIDILAQLRPVQYNFVKGAFGERVDTTLSRDGEIRFGLIAQEVEKILPEIVSSRGDSLKAISYLELIPFLIDAIQSQQNEIVALKNRITEAIQDDELKNALVSSFDNPYNEPLQPTLSQNVPNPFNENTIIKYSIPSINSTAMINVYNLQGKQLKSYKISHFGEGEIIIPAAELDPGIFIYNLIVDGSEIESLRMVLTD